MIVRGVLLAGVSLSLLLSGAVQLRAEDRKTDSSSRALKAGRHSFSLEAAGHKWTYAVHVPKTYDPEKATPLALLLHGAGGGGVGFLDQAGWTKKADEAGFIAVAPDGLPARPTEKSNFFTNPRLWNTGQLPESSPRSKIDDVAFFKALLDEVEKKLNVDKTRIYVSGHSNGAGMTFRLGAEMSERFAALAPVASHVWKKAPKPARPLPTLYIIGTEDLLVPLKGGERTLPWGKSTVPAVNDTLLAWAKALGCPTKPTTLRDKDGVKLFEYGPGKKDVKLTVCFIAGQGHNWPGGKKVLPERMVGPNSDKVNATDMIWDFFKKHRQSRE